MNQDALTGSVKRHEGLRTKAYQDSVGVWTIGYGRNLQPLQIIEKQAAYWLDEDVNAAVKDAMNFPEFVHLANDARENAFCEMVFNIGAPRVRKFERMLAAIAKEDWINATQEMLNSQWAK